MKLRVYGAVAALLLAVAAVTCTEFLSSSQPSESFGTNGETITIKPATATVALGDSARYQAWLTNNTGAAWFGRQIKWVLSDTTVARVVVTGVGSAAGTVAHVTTRKAGTTTLTATTQQGNADHRVLTVTGGTTPTDTVVTTVRVTPNPVTIASAHTFQLAGGAYNASGALVPGAGFWISGNPAVVTTDQKGLIRGVAPGTTNVEFHYAAKVAWSTVTDTGAATTPPPPPVTLVPADSFSKSVGVDTHFSYFDLLPYSPGANATRTAASAQALGVAFVRDGIPFSTDANWNNTAYAGLKAVATNGQRIVFVGQPAVEYQWTDTRAIDTALTRLGTSALLAFEGPNEVDNNYQWWQTDKTHPVDFGKNAGTFQCAMYAKAHARGVTVISPTVTSGTGASYMPDLTPCADGATIHPYPGGGLPMTNVAGMQAFTATFVHGKPSWITETGYHTNVNGTINHYQPGVSEAAAAKYVTREYLDYFRAGVVHSSTYELIDERVSTTDDEQNFGLLRNDGSPKPAYTALQTLLRTVADPGAPFVPAAFGFATTGATSTVRVVALAKRTGVVDLVFWNDVSVYDVLAKRDIVNAPVPVTLTLARAPSAVTQYTPVLGSQGAARTPATSLSVSVPDSPLVLEIVP